MHQMHLNLLLHNAKDETTICLPYYVFTFRMHELMYSCMCFRMHTSVQSKLVCRLHVSNNDNKKRNNLVTCLIAILAIDVKIVFTFFLLFLQNNAFLNVFCLLNISYFLVSRILTLLNLLISYIKRLLSDGFNMAAIGNFMKSHSPQTLSGTL